MNYRTRQRETILQVMRDEGLPLSAQQILEKASLRLPGIGAATIFRTLKQAVESGEVIRVELPGLPPQYEMNTGQHHHYFVCESCHTLMPLEGCVEGLPKLLPAGSRMKHHEIVIFGECATCHAP